MSKRNSNGEFNEKRVNELRAAVLSMVEEANVRALPERRVSFKAAITVANRDLKKTQASDVDRRSFSALRAVGAFISLAAINKVTEASIANADLLAVGHPLSQKSHGMSEAALRNERARWIAADLYIDDSVRSLVAAAHSYEPGSIERAHAFARLAALGPGILPITASIDLNTNVSSYTEFVLGLGLGGNSDMARRLRAKMQRRDRYGRFAFMGGGFSFSLRGLDGGFTKVSGRVVGASGDKDSVDIEVKGHKSLPDGIYAMPSSKGSSVKAILGDDVIKDLPDTDISIPGDDVFVSTDELKPMMAPTGWETKVTGTTGGNPSRWEHVSPDGYTVQDDGPDSAYRYTLRRQEGNTYVEPKSSFNSWADVQKAALADQDDYKAFLETKQVDDAAKADNAKKVESGEAPPYTAGRGNAWVKHENGKWYERELGRNYDISEEELQKMAKEATGPYLPPKDNDFGKKYKTSKGNWKEWDEGSDESWQYKQDYQKRLNGEYSKLKRLQEAQQAGLFDPKDDKFAVRDIVDPAAGDSIGAQISNATIRGESIRFNYDGKFDVTFTPKSGYLNKKTGQRNIVGLDAKGVQRTYAESKIAPPKSAAKVSEPEVKATIPEAPAAPQVDATPDVIDLDTSEMNLGETKEYIAGLAAKKQKIRFNYNGSERVVEPIEVWVNGQTGRINLRAMDNGTKKNFSFDKIEEPKAPTPDAPEGPKDISNLPGDELRTAIDDAIANGEQLKFTYSEKDRLVTPQEVWTNPKSGKVNLRAIDAE